MARKRSEGDRAILSSVFALVAGVTLIAFVLGVRAGAPPFQHWSLTLIFVWALMLGLGLLIWSARALPGRLGIHWIGNPTLGMVGGVSGGAIAAVALAFSLSSDFEQTQVLKQHATVLEKQLEALNEIRSELRQVRESLAVSARPEPGSARSIFATPGRTSPAKPARRP